MSETIVFERPPVCLEVLCVCTVETPPGALDFVLGLHDQELCESPRNCRTWESRRKDCATFRIEKPNPPHTHRRGPI